MDNDLFIVIKTGLNEAVPERAYNLGGQERTAVGRAMEMKEGFELLVPQVRKQHKDRGRNDGRCVLLG